MRRWEVPAFGLGNAILVDVPDPGVPGPGQARIEMKAWSLNYRDSLMVEGRYDPRIPMPFVPLSDGMGVVTEVGQGVSRVSVGDRVCPTFSATWLSGEPTSADVRSTRGGPIPGVLQESMVLSQEELVRVPDHLTATEAATLPCAALTAHSALDFGEVGAGGTVAVLGSGGVSTWALILARSRGARVWATTSTPAKAEILRSLGATEVWLYPEEPKWGGAVRSASDGGVDCVVEVGGAGTFAQSLRAVRVGGTVAVIGVVANDDAPGVSVMPILMRQIRCQGVFVGSRAGFEALCDEVRTHTLRPVVDRTFPFDALQEAMAHLRSGAHVGKVCLAVD
ncbi:MAG: NAD(P)-dependent alcohol dehydrogenase [Myxococcales bacterium]|nr:NAD(P)-dependent alcohol dehydrogenase [Myxococcales bacterium]